MNGMAGWSGRASELCLKLSLLSPFEGERSGSGRPLEWIGPHESEHALNFFCPSLIFIGGKDEVRILPASSLLWAAGQCVRAGLGSLEKWRCCCTGA
jgi:hypothetical protein